MDNIECNETIHKFIVNYNLTVEDKEDKLNLEKIKKRVFKTFKNYNNIYDKISTVYPNTKKYILNNYYKVYKDGKQILIEKDVMCNICSKNFSYCSAISYVNDLPCHNICKPKVSKLTITEELFYDLSFCKLCSLSILKNDCLMHDDEFYHKECYSNKVNGDHPNTLICNICSKPIIPVKGKHDYYVDKYDHTNVTHHKCLDDVDGYKRIIKFYSFNKCFICNFYIYGSKEYHLQCME